MNEELVAVPKNEPCRVLRLDCGHFVVVPLGLLPQSWDYIDLADRDFGANCPACKGIRQVLPG